MLETKVMDVIQLSMHSEIRFLQNFNVWQGQS
jgi:hypothetical protein